MHLDFLKNEHVILTDCDGVLLNWARPFQQWMSKRGYTPHSFTGFEVYEQYEVSEREAKDLVRAFNESVHIGHLPPYLDAVRYVRRLHEEHGFVFHVITAIDDHPHVYEARWNNLRNLFGTAIERLVLSGSKSRGGGKEQYLDQYAPGACVWIEDQWKNARLGVERNMDCYLMSHPHNIIGENDPKNQGILPVTNWQDLYYEIVGGV